MKTTEYYELVELFAPNQTRGVNAFRDDVCKITSLFGPGIAVVEASETENNKTKFFAIIETEWKESLFKIINKDDVKFIWMPDTKFRFRNKKDLSLAKLTCL